MLAEQKALCQPTKAWAQQLRLDTFDRTYFTTSKFATTTFYPRKHPIYAALQ